jgi:Phage terminase large subunit (GpA)
MSTAELLRAEKQNQYHRERCAWRREIGFPRPYSDEELELRAKCDDLRFFLRHCYPLAFTKPFSREHEAELDDTQRIIREGGHKARAAPRGDGKTTRIERAATWAILKALRRFCVPVGATQGHGDKMLKKIKTELWQNPQLWSLFRSEIFGIPQLANNARLCIGQTSGGTGYETQITWAANMVVMPTLAGSACSGSILATAGLTAAIRGLSHVTAGGEVLRPDLILLDDPQTRESAKSNTQTNDREDIVNGDVLGLAGPGETLAVFMLCTIIRRGDLSDRYLDMTKYPEWQGHRSSMVYSFPKNAKLWEEYREKRAESFVLHGNGKEATDFYAANREAMDDGAEVSWNERYKPDELSGIQHAMNLKFKAEEAFFAEYQNDPQDAPSGELVILGPGEIKKKLSGLAEGVAANDAGVLTAHIDVHDEVLFYAVGAFKQGFTGSVIERGTYPPQPAGYFTLRKAPRKLSHLFPGMAVEAVIVKALRDLIDQICGREWKRENGTVARLSQVIVDCGYKPEQVEIACRTSQFAPILMPSRGIGVGAVDTPFAERESYKKAEHGDNWYVAASSASGVPRIWFDSNYWKTLLHARLMTPLGSAGCISLFNAKPTALECFADHLSAEYPREVFARGRRVYQWQLRTGQDNHWLDNTVGCLVAASRRGISLEGQPRAQATRPQPRPRNRVSYIQ